MRSTHHQAKVNPRCNCEVKSLCLLLWTLVHPTEKCGHFLSNFSIALHHSSKMSVVPASGVLQYGPPINRRLDSAAHVHIITVNTTTPSLRSYDERTSSRFNFAAFMTSPQCSCKVEHDTDIEPPTQSPPFSRCLHHRRERCQPQEDEGRAASRPTVYRLHGPVLQCDPRGIYTYRFVKAQPA